MPICNDTMGWYRRVMSVVKKLEGIEADSFRRE